MTKPLPWFVDATIRIALTILLSLCLLKMPYGFYQFVRYVASAIFILLALDKTKNNITRSVFIALAVLFQPFFKIAIGRTIWNVVDVVVAAALLFSVIVLYVGRQKTAYNSGLASAGGDE